MALVHQPYTWQFHPPPYGPLRPVVGARLVRVLQTGELAGNTYSDMPLIQNYQRAGSGARRLAIRPPAPGLGAWPVVAVKGGIMAATAIANLKKRSGARRILATDIVDALEPVLVLNLDLYLAGPRTASEQQMRLGEWDEAWSFLISEDGCGTDDLGQAGRRCISDRQSGGQFDWRRRYRDPIADDVLAAGAQPLAAGVPDFLASVFGAPSASGAGASAAIASYAPLLIGVVLIGAAFLVKK